MGCRGRHIARAPDGSLVVAGYHASGSYGCVVRLSSTGSVLWNVDIEVGDTSDLNDVEVDVWGRIFVAGRTYDGTATEGYLAELSPADGSIVWSTTPGAHPDADFIAMELKPLTECNPLTMAGCGAGEVCEARSLADGVGQKFVVTRCGAGGTAQVGEACRVGGTPSQTCEPGLVCIEKGAENVCAKVCNEVLGGTDCVSGTTCNDGQPHGFDRSLSLMGICG